MLTLDAHIDVPWQQFKRGEWRDLRLPCPETMFDLPRMKEGGLDSAIFALYLSDAVQDQLGPEESWFRLTEQLVQLSIQTGIRIESGTSAAMALDPDLVPIFLSLEGGRLLNCDITRLRTLVGLGVSSLILTHNKTSDWCDSATDISRHGGLSAFGLGIVDEADKLGMILDVSHSSDDVVDQLTDDTDYLVMASHSGVRSLIDHPRNLLNRHIKRIAGMDGVIGIPLAKRFVGTLHDAMGHIDHIVDLVGNADHVGIGSDLDGAVMVDGFEGVENWSMLGDLLTINYSDSDVAKILGGNFFRVLG